MFECPKAKIGLKKAMASTKVFYRHLVLEKEQSNQSETSWHMVNQSRRRHGKSQL